jgi:hypothetical protein
VEIDANLLGLGFGALLHFGKKRVGVGLGDQPDDHLVRGPDRSDSREEPDRGAREGDVKDRANGLGFLVSHRFLPVEFGAA